MSETQPKADVEQQSTGTIVSTLADSVDDEVVLRFDSSMSVPTGKYGGPDYGIDELDETKVTAEISLAEIEDIGQTLMCFADISTEELRRHGLRPDVAGSVDGGWRMEIFAMRETPGDNAPSREEAEKAVEEGNWEILPSWKGRPTAKIQVSLTKECRQRHAEFGHSMKRTHELGVLHSVE